MSLPTRECGLKLANIITMVMEKRHSPRGSVD